MFERAYCINLPHRQDRWEHFLKEQEFLNFNIEKFEAINGKTCGILPGKPPHPTWSIISLGNLGNVLSQRKIIFKCKKENVGSVLIFEDDVEFDKSVILQEYIDSVPKNWDMAYFGGAHREPLIPINDKWGQTNFTLTAHAVVIKNTMYDKILNITSGLGAPIDLYYAMLHKNNNVYATLKPIAWQMHGYSDIGDTYVEYGHLR